MPIDKSLIGASSSPKTFEVTEEAVRRFMEATEDPALQSSSPQRSLRSAFQSSRGSAPLSFAPPTFPTTFRGTSIPGLVLDTSRMQLLHGEQEYRYTRRLRIGEQVTCVARILDVRERAGRSGSMTFIVTETTGVDSEQQVVFTARSTSIVRQK